MKLVFTTPTKTDPWSNKAEGVRDLIAFADLARLCGAEYVYGEAGNIIATVSPSGVLLAVARLSSTAPASVPATVAAAPPSTPEQAAVPPVAPEVRRHGAKKSPLPKPGGGRGGRPKADGGTCSHAILNAVADAGGTIRASAAKVGADYGTGTDQSNKKMASVLVADGLLTTTPRTGPTSLTAKGWAAIGRTAPAALGATEAPPKPDLAAVPDPPAIPDLGPIERRPFDPDRVREQQANAL